MLFFGFKTQYYRRMVDKDELTDLCRPAEVCMGPSIITKEIRALIYAICRNFSYSRIE